MFGLNLWVLIGGLILVALQFFLAWHDWALTPSDMAWQFRNSKSILPITAHGAVWMAIPLTFVLAYLVAKHSNEWTGAQFALALVLGLVISAAMHWMYCKFGTIPEAHVQFGKLMPAGWVQVFFLAGSIAIIALEYLGTKAPSSVELWWVTGFLTVYTAVGNHFVLGLIHPSWYNERPLESPIGWATVIGVGLVLGIASAMRGV